MTKRLVAEGIAASMDSVGDALDNAMCESLIGTMKIDKLDRQPWRSAEDVRAGVFNWIERWYNPPTLQSRLPPTLSSSRANTATDTRTPTP